MAAHAGVPVVNALTDQFHPCQALADLLTVREHRGTLAGQTLAFVGDAACNMGHSLLLAGATAGMHVRVSGPDGYQPGPGVLADGPGDRRRDRRLGRASSPTRRGRRRRRRRRHRHLGLDGPARPRRRPAPRCSRPGSSTTRCWRTRAADAIVLHCLPGLPRQGDHRRGARRTAQRGLGRGREPPARPEGRPRLAARLEASVMTPTPRARHIPPTKSARQQLDRSTCSTTQRGPLAERARRAARRQRRRGHPGHALAATSSSSTP